MRTMLWFLLPVISVAIWAHADSARCGDVLTLQGAGATFPAPLYQRWFSEFAKTHPQLQINYLQQAKRVADMTAFLYVDTSEGGRTGYLVEYDQTHAIFESPREQHTKEYIRGEFS
jgi:ABC-type phosphate transport system substrate-binding protein